MKRVLCMIVFLCFPALATNAQSSDTNFTIEIVYPENQIEKDAGYFYITGDKSVQSIEVKIKNISQNDITVKVETASCYSSPTGDLVYIKDNRDASLGYIDGRYSIESNIKPSSEQVKLGAYKEKPVFFQISDIPALQGEVIGAVRFFEDLGVQQKNNDNIQINIRKSITIPVRIRLSDFSSANGDAIEIGEASFDSQKGLLKMYVFNKLAVINKNVRLTYWVCDHKDNKLFEGDVNLYKMAPKTFVMLPVKWDYPTAAHGRYTIKVNYFIYADKNRGKGICYRKSSS